MTCTSLPAIHLPACPELPFPSAIKCHVLPVSQTRKVQSYAKTSGASREARVLEETRIALALKSLSTLWRRTSKLDIKMKPNYTKVKPNYFKLKLTSEQFEICCSF